MTASEDPKREFLRHTLATLAYRGAKVLRDVPHGFATLDAGEGARTPIEILSHIGDLFDWMLHLLEGRQVWTDRKPASWAEEVERFFDLLRRVDDRLASPVPTGAPVEQLFQGPVADALTHVGQLALLRRRAGAPIKGENYFKADIAAGRVGRVQSDPRFEF